MRIFTALLLGIAISSVARAADPQPPTPAATNPSTPHSSCAATAAASNWECPTCGHHGSCPTCGHGSDFPGVSRLWNWATYRACRNDKSCKSCCEPCRPPLYAWFPCAGDCDSCAGHGASASCKPGKAGKCGTCKGHCASGYCGEYRFANFGREKFLYTDGSCGAHCGSEMGMPATAAATPTGPAMPAAPTASEPPPQQSVSYKKDAEAVAASVTPPKPATTNRTTTYRSDAVRPQMPVLSPDQFRKQK